MVFVAFKLLKDDTEMQHQTKIHNIETVAEIQSWYRNTFGCDIEFDIKTIDDIFSPVLELTFRNSQEQSLFLLRFGS